MGLQVSKLFWLWIPVLVFAVQIVIEVMFSSEFLAKLHTENGPHEIAQSLIMALTFVVSVLVLFRRTLCLDFKVPYCAAQGLTILQYHRFFAV